MHGYTHGKSPIALTFHIPKASASRLHPMNANFTMIICSLFPGLSNLEKVFCMFSTACIGPLNSMKTIMMLKIWRPLPVMYMPMAFMGSCLAGARANSHAFFSLEDLRVSGDRTGSRSRGVYGGGSLQAVHLFRRRYLSRGDGLLVGLAGGGSWSGIARGVGEGGGVLGRDQRGGVEVDEPLRLRLREGKRHGGQRRMGCTADGQPETSWSCRCLQTPREIQRWGLGYVCARAPASCAGRAAITDRSISRCNWNSTAATTSLTHALSSSPFLCAATTIRITSPTKRTSGPTSSTAPHEPTASYRAAPLFEPHCVGLRPDTCMAARSVARSER